MLLSPMQWFFLVLSVNDYMKMTTTTFRLDAGHRHRGLQPAQPNLVVRLTNRWNVTKMFASRLHALHSFPFNVDFRHCHLRNDDPHSPRGSRQSYLSADWPWKPDGGQDTQQQQHQSNALLVCQHCIEYRRNCNYCWCEHLSQNHKYSTTQFSNCFEGTLEVVRKSRRVCDFCVLLYFYIIPSHLRGFSICPLPHPTFSPLCASLPKLWSLRCRELNYLLVKMFKRSILRIVLMFQARDQILSWWDSFSSSKISHWPLVLGWDFLSLKCSCVSSPPGSFCRRSTFPFHSSLTEAKKRSKSRKIRTIKYQKWSTKDANNWVILATKK